MSGAEADAWEDDLPDVAQRMSALQRDFLGQHLLRWLPPLALAIRRQGQAFYTALVELTVATVAAHWADVGQEASAEFACRPGQTSLETTGPGSGKSRPICSRRPTAAST